VRVKDVGCEEFQEERRSRRIRDQHRTGCAARKRAVSLVELAIVESCLLIRVAS
jgi:hypothetical protein